MDIANIIAILFVSCIFIIILSAIIYNYIYFSKRRLRKIYNKINIGDIYVDGYEYEFPKKHSPFDEKYLKKYEVIDKKDGWLRFKDLGNESNITDISIKDFLKGYYILEK